MNLTIAAITIAVTVTGGPGNPRDWLGVFPTNAPSTVAPIGWVYLACNAQNCPTMQATSGTVKLTLPLTDGSYEIRFLSATGAKTYSVLGVIDPGVTH